MSEEPPAKKARKGTRSCLECRHRKVRCQWPHAGADVCQNCSVRGEKCESQEHTIATGEAAKLTSRSRIGYLESNVSTLWKAVERLESALGCAPYRDGHTEHKADTGHDDSDSDTSINLSTENLPTHLGYLFGDISSGPSSLKSRSRLNKTRKSPRVASLKTLLPPRDDMIKITKQAWSWMNFDNAVFPTLNMMRSGEHMLSQYDILKDIDHGDDNIISLAALLLSIAMTIQHAPKETLWPTIQCIKDGSKYIRDISETVERNVLVDDLLAGTLEGIEVSMLYLRLQLSRTQLRKMWLFLRRVIALAEIISLPRAASLLSQSNAEHERDGWAAKVASPPDNLLSRKSAAWEAISIVDRIYSVLWSLPLATSNYPFPKKSIIGSDGSVRVQPFLMNLAEIASRVIDLDQVYATGGPLAEQIDAVNKIDRELEMLAASVPQNWWRVEWSEYRVDATLQFWHGYLTIRAHFQLALASYVDPRFAAHFTTCLVASQNLARRYICLRPIIGRGFFANPVFDLQAFTAAIFLLFANYRATWGSANVQPTGVALNTDLTDGVLAAMHVASASSDTSFARQGVQAIKSLKSLFQRPHTSETDQFTLTLPLVGKVRVSRKSLVEPSNHARLAGPVQSRSVEGISQTVPHQQQDNTAETLPSQMVSQQDNFDPIDALSFSMEYIESNPLMADEIFANEDWLSWSGWDTHGRTN